MDYKLTTKQKFKEKLNEEWGAFEIEAEYPCSLTVTRGGDPTRAVEVMHTFQLSSLEGYRLFAEAAKQMREKFGAVLTSAEKETLWDWEHGYYEHEGFEVTWDPTVPLDKSCEMRAYGADAKEPEARWSISIKPDETLDLVFE